MTTDIHGGFRPTGGARPVSLPGTAPPPPPGPAPAGATQYQPGQIVQTYPDGTAMIFTGRYDAYGDPIFDFIDVGGAAGGGAGRTQFPSEQAQDYAAAAANQAQADLYRQQAANIQAQLDYDYAVLTETIRDREQRMRELEIREAGATQRERERITHEKEQLQAQLAFDREQLAENRRQYDQTLKQTQAEFGQQRYEFEQTFGEGQRQFDTQTGMQYLQTASQIEDPLGRAAFLLGDSGGVTPTQGAFQMFRPVALKQQGQKVA